MGRIGAQGRRVNVIRAATAKRLGVTQPYLSRL